MEKLTDIRQLFRNKEEYADKTVTVGGWLRSRRDSKTFGFLVINDGTFFEPLQVIYSDKLDNYAEISKLNVGAAVIVTGKLILTTEAKQSKKRREPEMMRSLSALIKVIGILVIPFGALMVVKEILWLGRDVPAVLTSGDHAAVTRWKREQSLARTAALRPDLLDNAVLSENDLKFLKSLAE